MEEEMAEKTGDSGDEVIKKGDYDPHGRDGGQPVGDYGLRKRRVASREHLPLSETSSGGQGFRSGLQDPQVRSQPVKMRRPIRQGKFSQFVPTRKSTLSDEADKPPEPKKEIKTDILKRWGWATADIHKGYDAAYIIFAMRDFILYLIYLTALLFITVGTLYSAHNFYSDLISDLITNSQFLTKIGKQSSVIGTFPKIKTHQQLWSFVFEILLKFFYDDPDPLKRGNTVLLESILIGTPRIRQLRAMNNTCETAPLFRDLYKTCYDYYSSGIKDRRNIEPYYGDLTFTTDSYPWKYFSERTLHERTIEYRGVMGTYGGGGWSFNLTADYAFTRAWLSELKYENWIRLGTRFVTIDFAMYTPNTNLFCVVKLAFELIPCGGIIPHQHFYTLKLFRYSTAYDVFLLGCEIAFICFTIYYTFEEAQQIYILKEAYLANWWNVLDVAINLLSYVTIAMGIYTVSIVATVLPEQLVMIRTSVSSNFDVIVHAQNTFNQTIGVLLFLAWLKLLKFSSLNRSIVMILSVFYEVCEEVFTVISMSLMITTGYAICGHILFGFRVLHFQTPRRSMVTMLSMYIGRMQFFKECQKVFPFIAPIFFASYIIIIIIIYFNMFVALLVHGFNRVIVFMNEEPDRLYLDDWIYSFVVHALILLRQYHAVQRLIAKNTLARQCKDYDELVRILKRQGMYGVELELLLQTYNIRRGAELKLEEMFEMYNDVCVRNQLFIEVEDHNDIFRTVDKIEKMIEHCEQAVVDVVAKCEILSDKVAPPIGKSLSK